MQPVDVIIIGQGLAGTALAWQLLRRGRSVFIVDREPTNTSSRIAAGLLTPITGKRLAVSRQWDDFLPVARTFYHEIEAILGTRFFQTTPCVRLFAYETERKQFAKYAAEFSGLVCDPEPPINSDWFETSRGGFQMPTAARLETRTYLDTSREYFRERGFYHTLSVDLEDDLAVSSVGVRLLPLSVQATRLVFCQGFDGSVNPYFPDVMFNAAKGEILTLRVPRLEEPRVVNRGVWITQDHGEHYRCGATYSWNPLDCEPTIAGREEILTRLKALLKLPVEVVHHAAAVRPIIEDRSPLIRWHADFPNVGYFNGLGSKGSLLAPYFAGLVAEACC